MTLTFRSSAPETITHDYGRAKYVAVQDGMNWNVTGHNEKGTPVNKTIFWSNNFEASHQLLNLAMEQHDEARRNRPASPRDRVVSVDPMGNSMSAPITMSGRDSRRR
jgi:hypothetical protein